MSHISAIFGTDDDQEILNSLYIIANVCYIFLDWFLADTLADRTQMDLALFMNLNQYTILQCTPGAGLLGPIATLQR